MRPIILFSLVFLSIFSVSAQKNNPLVGKWKIIGSFDGNILHDFKTDSVMQFSTAVQRSKNDLILYSRTTKSIYQNNSYEFSNSGLYKHYLADNVFFEGTYRIDRVQQLIIATSNNTRKKRIEVFKYSVNGIYMDLLIMDRKEKPFVNTTFPLVFKLEKI
ncbi:MAG: hypothetical protein JWO92_430 [Chitinophagaceae bacterium]|nr:hypothetical protein [Chitinophagaceae bacterium]